MCNFSDPFGLCPEAQRDKSGNCPGGLSVSQWEAVDQAAGQLHSDVASLIRAKLAAGEIHAGEERDARIMGRGDPVSGDITLMTNTWYGSAFDLGVADLAQLVAHEYRHTTQLTGVSAGTAMSIRQSEARMPWRLRPMEIDAAAFACESMLPSARGSTRVPSQLPCR